PSLFFSSPPPHHPSLLSLHDALPISGAGVFIRHGKVSPAAARTAIETLLGTPSLAAAAQALGEQLRRAPGAAGAADLIAGLALRSEEHTSELQSLTNLVCRLLLEKKN